MMIDDTIPPTPGTVNPVMNKANGVVHLVEGKVKEPAHVETNDQNVPNGQIFLESLSILEGSSAPEGQSVLDAP